MQKRPFVHDSVCRGRVNREVQTVMREGCGAELQKLPRWLLPHAVAGNFFRKMRCGNWTLSRCFKCKFGGGSRGAEEERKHAETQIARVERRKLC